jgi:hypothetical protein
MTLKATAKPMLANRLLLPAGPFGFAVLLAGGRLVREEFLLTTPNKQ